MKYCTRCVMPDTKPGVFMDDEGVCNACRSVENKKHFDWDARRKELGDICKNIKATNKSCYDCIVPVSGGKDSQYQVWMMKEVYGMNVLAVCLAAHLPTEEGIHNFNSMITNLEVDCIKVTLKPEAYRKIRRKCFIQQGEPNWAEHCAVFSAVANVAVCYEVPLIVWGEDIAVEFGGRTSTIRKADANDINTNDLIKDKTICNWLDDEIREADVYFYKYPSVEELNKLGIRSVYLGYYDNWDGQAHYGLAQKYGFTGRQRGALSGNIINYDNIDEKLCEINIWMKYIKFGFWRPTDQCCYQIWNDRLTRAEAVKLVNAKQGEFPQEYLQDFLDFHMLTEREFWDVVESFRNHAIWEKNTGQWRLKYPLT